MQKILTKQNYLFKLSRRFPFVLGSINYLKKKHWTGRLIQIQISLEKGNFYLSLAVKAKYMGLSAFFLPSDWIKCICIGTENKGFGSSIRIRLVDGGFLVERKIHICSPLLIDMFLYKHTKAKKHLKSKAKLYYFANMSIKKYLNIHYYN